MVVVALRGQDLSAPRSEQQAAYTLLHLLDQSLRGFGAVCSEVRVVNARHVEHVPGQTKTDVLDCQWIQKLHNFGLLNGSFRPISRVANCASTFGEIHFERVARARDVGPFDEVESPMERR
jgi:hypothetical protein